jgi:protein SCO1/2
LIVYFGYTFCPDVCPTTLAEVKKALKQLGSKADRVDLAMITIDPNRDSDAIITGYVQSFIPSAHALRTDDQTSLEATAAAFGASYSVTTAADGAVEVSHSAAMYVVDSTGTVVLTWPFGIPADGIATDLDILFGRDAK